MKLKYRFLLPALIAVALIMTLLGSVLMTVSFRARFDGERDRLAKSVRAISYAIEAAYTNYALQNMNVDDEKLREIARGQGADIAALAEGYANAGAIRLLGQILRAETPLRLGDTTYLLTVESDLSELFEQRAHLLKCYCASYAAAILLTAGVMLFICGYVTRPLTELTQASAALAEGDMTRRAHVHADDEIGALAQSFNRMADELTDQLARRTQFINDLTHEMKTPLSAMIGHAETIRTGRLGAEDTLIAAQTILREGKRLDALSRAMTEWILLKHEAPPMTELSAHMIIEDAIAAFPRAALNIRVAEDSRDAMIFGNRALLTALITNLIKNALNADATEVTLTCMVRAAAVWITVADDGCGMNEQELARAAEPFYRADKARSRESGGVGLGLALSDEIARIYSGALSFESAPGMGTKAILEMTGKAVETDA